MNRYIEMSRRHQALVDDFLNKYAFFAFSEKQFKEGLQKFNIEEGQKGALVRLPGSGGFMLKEHAPAYKELAERIAQEQQDAIADPATGADFAYQMFKYELANHEYTYTGTTWETLDALGYTAEEVNEDPVLRHALQKACEDLLNEA